MSRSRSERLVAAAALILASACGLAAARAGAQEPPSPEAVKDASFSDGTVGFSEGTVSFTDGTVGFSDGTVSFPDGTVSFTTGALAQPSSEGSPGELRFELTADLLFDFDKADLRPEAESVLREAMAEIKAKAKRPAVRVEGHTDAMGSDEYNQGLSERRAASVRTWFVEAAKLPTKSVSAVGFGERQPIADNEKPDGSDDPEGRQKNRRVELVVTSQG